MNARAARGRLEDILRLTTIELVRGDNPDLTARQLGVFLICYAEPEPQTVRGMAETLNVSRPVISRALDRLSELGLVRRRVDPRDRRNVLVQRTGAGLAFLRYLRLVLQDAADQADAVAIVRATAPWSLTAGQAAHRLPPRPPE